MNAFSSCLIRAGNLFDMIEYTSLTESERSSCSSVKERARFDDVAC